MRPIACPAWAWWIATGFGSGLLRPCPGTWGSLAALMVWALMDGMTHRMSIHFPVLKMAVPILFLIFPLFWTWVGIEASKRVSEAMDLKDPGWVVVDEWVGMWLTLWPLQGLGFRKAWVLMIPFGVFRLLDIWKPWPCRDLEKLSAGQGIMADDLVAGLYGIPLMVLLRDLLRLHS